MIDLNYLWNAEVNNICVTGFCKLQKLSIQIVVSKMSSFPSSDAFFQVWLIFKALKFG